MKMVDALTGLKIPACIQTEIKQNFHHFQFDLNKREIAQKMSLFSLIV